MSAHRLTVVQALIVGVALDVSVVTALTILGALHVIPGASILPFLGIMIGARVVRSRGGDGGDGGAGTSSPGSSPRELGRPAPRGSVLEFSVVAALAGLLFAFLVPHHHGEA